MPQEINSLIQGYNKFREEYFATNKSHFMDLVRNGQNPKILIISCSDSRVDPSLIFNCRPGDLFIVRNVANLIPPCEDQSSYHGTSAALEFGICGLGIRHVVILGHSQCGGIKALLNSSMPIEKNKSFIGKWMDIAENAKNQTLDIHRNLSIEEQTNACSKIALVNSLNNLKTFPWINEKVKNGSVFLHAWYFELETCVINSFNENKSEFEELKALFMPPVL